MQAVLWIHTDAWWTSKDPIIPLGVFALTSDTMELVQGDGSSNWSALTPFGSSVGGGPETDPVFTASAAAGISSGDISNWNGKIDEDDAIALSCVL